MQNIKEIQQYNGKVILEAIYGEDSKRYLEELATKKLLDESDGPTGYGHWVRIREEALYVCYPDINDDWVENDYLMSVDKFISQLLTLPRVLLALQKKFCLKLKSEEGYVGIALEPFDVENDKYIIWDLTKETLEEQTEETQLAIAKLLGYNEGI